MSNHILNVVDVNSFRDALSLDIIDNSKKCSQSHLLKIVKNAYRCSFVINEEDAKLNNYVENYLSKINYPEYGFNSIKDVSINQTRSLFDNSVTIELIPKNFYCIRRLTNLPHGFNPQTSFYQLYLADLYERVKIKLNSVLQSSNHDEKDIELYVKKNIQLANNLFDEAISELDRVQSGDNISLIFNYVSLSAYLMNLLLYLKDIFSEFYSVKFITQQTLKAKICDAVSNDFINKLFESKAIVLKTEELFNQEPKNENLSIKWNCQINTLITMFYDLANNTMKNGKKMMETNNEDIEALLTQFFIDKNGKQLSPLTIKTCLKDYREDKRAKGLKRIIVPKC